jgi:hypothetical protein
MKDELCALSAERYVKFDIHGNPIPGTGPFTKRVLPNAVDFVAGPSS